ncbi:MAG: filamentous hemagglutinin family protein [Methylococcaceae bacterium]
MKSSPTSLPHGLVTPPHHPLRKSGLTSDSSAFSLAYSPWVIVIHSLLSLAPAPTWAELPVPAEVLVAPGSGQVAAPVVSGNTMTIRQLSDQATLDWKRFNIGPDNRVRFEQPHSDSVALNNIHQADPSQILGSLSANGQVYLVNQNGFVFGEQARVDANALVVSSLDISQDTLARGLARSFSTGQQPDLSSTRVEGQPGAIVVEPGALLSTSATNGRILLAAPNITQKGTLHAPDGQILLAASQDKVYLQQASADSDIRGLVVEVDTGGSIENLGNILAERGNVSLLGFAVNQDGRVSASTSVRLEGTVRLLAREGFRTGADGSLLPGVTQRATDRGDGLGQFARVNLGKNSLTQVALDTGVDQTAVDAQTQSQSRVEVSAHDVNLAAGAQVLAHSGTVALVASDDPSNPSLKGSGRVYLDSGSRVDVSGIKDVPLPASRHVLSVELRSNELRDAPLQREGVLHGQTVQVDLRDVEANGRIPIADVSGALARIERSLDERSTRGGSLSIRSSGDLIAQPGSVLDVSGGSVRYLPGWIETSQLRSGGVLYDIGRADPSRHYDALLKVGETLHPAWGLVNRWLNAGVGLARFDSGYVEGKAGGTLDLAAYSAQLDGLLSGKTVTGQNQRTVSSAVESSHLGIDLNQGTLQGYQAVVLGEDGMPSSPALNLSSASLADSGFGHIDIKTNATLTVPAETHLHLPAGGSLSVAASGFDIAGAIRIPSGSIRMNPIALNVEGVPLPRSSGLVLGQHARLSVSGNWVNDTHPTEAVAAPDGGTVELSTEQQNLVLEPGSLIDADGGAWLSGDGHLQGGQGGRIALTAQTTQAGQPASDLILQGDVRALGVSQGGRLSLASREVSIVATPDDTASGLRLTPDFFRHGGFADYQITANHDGLSVADGVVLSPSQSTRRLPDQLQDLVSADDLPGSEGNTPASFRMPDDLRQPVNLSLAVSQTAEQNRNSVLRIGQNAQITVEPSGRIALASDTSMEVAGRLRAPGGEIALSLDKPVSGDHGYFAAQSLWLESGSALSATGVFRPQRNNLGRVLGEVLPGGRISLEAHRGYLMTAPDALIDVSGTQANLDFLADAAHTPGYFTQSIASSGGSIELRAGEGIVSAARLLAQSGGAGASGGSIKVELNGDGRSKPTEPIPGGVFPDDVNLNLPRRIVVNARVTDISQGVASGLRFGDEFPVESYSGQVFLSADRLNAAQAGSLTLSTDAINLNGGYTGSIGFAEAISLHADRDIVLNSPSLVWLPSTPGRVRLEAPRVVVGSTRSRVDQLSGSTLLDSSLAPPPHTGPGTFTVWAQGIDLIGGLSFDGYGQVEMQSQGDVRAIGIREARETRNFLGALHLAGDLTITASQFYPATLSDYTVTLEEGGVFRLNASESPRTPIYSAGGRLTLHANTIEQHGVLAAPFGQLQLEAETALQLYPGSLSTVSGNGLTVPLGRGSGDLTWLYPLESSGLINRLINTPPEKRLALSAPSIQLDSGATLDLSGGGDLFAWEFIPGPGGSRDVLGEAQHDSGYAIIPGLHSISTPYDPLEFPDSGLAMGDSIDLAGGSGLPAGEYTLLPAHYALLPGAWWIRPEANTQDMTPGQTHQRLDGAKVVAGRYQVADTGLHSSRWQGFAVQPGSVARQYSEYHDYSANRFFTAQAQAAETPIPRLPQDAGSLAVAAGQALSLEAWVLSEAPEGGRGGDMDISAQHLAIVGRRDSQRRASDHTVILLADELNRLNVASLVLGGWRDDSSGSSRLNVMSQSVKLDNQATLTGQDVILVARNRVDITSGSGVVSTGKTSDTVEPLTLTHTGTGNDDGVLLRVSARPQLSVIRSKTSGKQGLLTVEAGATLSAQGSILLDATRDTRFQGDIALKDGALAVSARAITIGTASPDTRGLVISADQLAVDELLLSSPGGILFNGASTLNTRHLILDTPVLRGSGDPDTAVVLQADTLRWQDHYTQTPSASPDTGAASSLNLSATHTLELGSGALSTAGFAHTTLSAGLELRAGEAQQTASGRLSVPGSLTLDTPRFSGYSGGRIDVESGAITLSAPTTSPSTWPDAGLGVTWTMHGERIGGVGRFDVPAGAISLNAESGGIQLDAGSRLDVSARRLSFGETHPVTPAGSIQLTAQDGDIVLAQGASLDLSGDDDGRGALSLSSPNGRLIWDGQITASLATARATPAVQLDVGRWNSASLWQQLAEAGFRDSVSVRLRQGSIVLPADTRFVAHDLELRADHGSVDIEGQIDASGDKGGRVHLLGAEGIRLGTASTIDAHARDSAGQGGTVILDAIPSTAVAAESGTLNLLDGSRIDVSGGTADTGGDVHLRTGRNESTGTLAISPLATRITGSAQTVLEATRIYSGITRIDAETIAGIQADTTDFMAKVVLPDNPYSAVLQVQPGIDIRNSGDISLTQTWDFMDDHWRYQGEPGVLSITAGGQLNLQASLTDGFANTALPDPLGMILPDIPVTLHFHDVMQPVATWSYALRAGTDLTLAPRYKKTQVMVRTGTGDISLDAGGSIRFLADARHPDAAAAVYTAGRPAPYTWGDLMLGHIPGIAAPGAGEDLAQYLSRLDPVRLAGLLRNGYTNEYRTAWQFVAEYPTGGGDLSLRAGANIEGLSTGQRISDWLVRTGTWSDDSNDSTRTATAWGLNLSGSTANELVETVDAEGNPLIFNVKGRHYFNQNLGALGGGTVTVTAGGDVEDLSVMVPGTGKPMGIWTTPATDGKPDPSPYSGLNARWLTQNTQPGGGGSFRVQAGGDIQGGEFYADRGTGLLEAGGSILADRAGLDPVAMLGDARFDVNARQDLNWGTALNPTLLPQQDIPDQWTGKTANFVTYSDDSALRLQSLGGNIQLNRDLSAWMESRHYSLDEQNEINLALYPGTLKAYAYSGDLAIEGSINLMPNPEGQLELWAGRDLGTHTTGNNSLAVNVSDADPRRFPRVDAPETQLISNTPGAQTLNQLLDASSPDATTIHAALPVHTGDTRKILIAAQRDIAVPDGSRLTFFLPKVSAFQAGRDFRNISVYGQNLSGSDVTTLETGRDLVFATVLDANGNVASLDQRVQWGGPGQLTLRAGRNVSLGGSNGISSVGNLSNRALPGGVGAAVDVWAGVSIPPDVSGFLDTYLEEYQNRLTPAEQEQAPREQAVSVLFQALKQAAGTAAAAPESARKALYQPGFAALQRLFPGQGSQNTGHLSLVFSQIKSLDGGRVDLLIPGGSVDVGLAGQVGGVQKSASQLGIVVQGAGAFNAYTLGNFNVNQSRVFTLGGGDIAIWSSTGSIDAGKGAKSTLSAPPPVTTVDEKGNIVTVFPPIVSGSGIQAITPTRANAQAGSVYLAAPAGVVNAGEAGISGGKVVIAASAVIGASNIQASGGTVGVPTAVAPPVIPTGASGAAAGAARAATQTGEADQNDPNRNADAEARGRKAMGSLLRSEVVGFGSCSVADVRSGQPGCGGAPEPAPGG